MGKGQIPKSGNDDTGDSIDLGNLAPDNSNSDAGRDAGGVEIIDPASLAGSDSGGRKPRSDKGRKRKARQNGQDNQISVSGVEVLLLSIHVQLANWTHNPELEWTKEEANNVAVAFAAVQDHYPATRIDPGIMAVMTFVGLMLFTEGTKISAILVRVRREKREATNIPVVNANTPQQASAVNPAPAAASTFENIQPWKPFGEEAPSPRGVIDFPIIRGA